MSSISPGPIPISSSLSPRPISTSSHSFSGKNTAAPKGKMAKRESSDRERDREKRTQLMVAYRNVLKIFKILETHYASGEKKKFKLETVNKGILLKAKDAYQWLPKVGSLVEMKNSNLDELIEQHKQKVINSVLIGLNEDFGKKAVQMQVKINQGQDVGNDRKEFTKLKTNAFHKYEHTTQMKNAKTAMNSHMKQTVSVLKKAYITFGDKTKAAFKKLIEEEAAKVVAKAARQAATIALRESKEAELAKIKEGKILQKIFQKKEITAKKKGEKNQKKIEKIARNIAQKNAQQLLHAAKVQKKTEADAKKATRTELAATKAAKKAFREAEKAQSTAIQATLSGIR